MSREAREEGLARVASSPESEAFTGADLQALVDTAQLAAIHGYLEVGARCSLLSEAKALLAPVVALVL